MIVGQAMDTCCGTPSRTGMWKISSASSTAPSIFAAPPVSTMPAASAFVAAAAQFGLHQREEFLVARLHHLGQRLARELPRRRSPTLGTWMLSSARASCASAQAYLSLISSAWGRRAQRHRDVVGDLIAGDRQHAGVAIAPWANTAMSVVPPPMSTSSHAEFALVVGQHRVAGRQRLQDQVVDLQAAAGTHLVMFCAAVAAQVTRCTGFQAHAGHAERVRMPSCSSITYSCGRMCRIFWSAGIGTALAASSTRSTSLGHFPSRMATMPCELRLRTWLPLMPA
jgi:hypothetical protein